MSHQPKYPLPKSYFKFLGWFCDPMLREDVEGDLTELYQARANISLSKAKIHLAIDILLLFRPGIIRKLSFNNLQFHNNMFKNHIIAAIRHAFKFKAYTLINLLGLVIGLSSSILILLWVQDEVEKDKFHVKSDRIYQVWRNMHQADGAINTTGGIPQPLAVVLKDEYPEIDQVTLISWEMEMLFKKDDQSSFELGRYVSPDFFNMFSYPLITGDPNSVLYDLHSVVISDRMAKIYFGENWQDEQNILGQVLKIDERQDFAISGVFKNTDENSSIQFDWLLPAQEYINRKSWVESWYNGSFRMYISLEDPASLKTTQKKVINEINTHTENAADERIFLQKFSETYLYSNFNNGQPDGGRIRYVQMLLIMAIFILVIASINYMNLFTAQASRRAREIGVRKIIGASKSSLSMQFFIESFLLSITSLLLALGLVFITIPYFNGITGKALMLEVNDPKFWIGIVVVILFTTLLSGSYPAIRLPSFKIINSLKGGVIKTSGSLFRNGLVVFQLALSILLIAGTIVVSQQMGFIMNKDLGLDRDRLLFINMEGDLAQKSDAYKTALLKLPEINAVTFTSGNPISYGSSTGGASWDGKNPDDVVEINVLTVDLNFIKTMAMEMETGRDFSDEFGTDSSKFIINEVLADIMGFENPLAQNLSVWGEKGSIIGVVKDFHMSSMYEPIMPLIIRYDPDGTEVAFIRTQDNIAAAIEAIEKVTLDLNPAYPFQYDFLDDDFKEAYRSETTLSTLANIFAIVSIFISCLGLLGISSFSADQRSKEIGVRKVHGASILAVVLMLSKDYAKLMAIAIIIAVPIAYYYMQLWLSKFAFRIELNMVIFITAGAIAFVVGALTVGYKSYMAATINPVRTLKAE
jgi:putative ABC transport system permease protein